MYKIYTLSHSHNASTIPFSPFHNHHLTTTAIISQPFPYPNNHHLTTTLTTTTLPQPPYPFTTNIITLGDIIRIGNFESRDYIIGLRSEEQALNCPKHFTIRPNFSMANEDDYTAPTMENFPYNAYALDSGYTNTPASIGNTTYQHMTHPINITCQRILSTLPINSHAINTLNQHTLSTHGPINPSYQCSL